MIITKEIIETAKVYNACERGLAWGYERLDKPLEINNSEDAAHFLFAYKFWRFQERDSEMFDKAMRLNPYPAVRYNADQINQDQFNWLITQPDMPNTLLLYAKELMSKEEISFCEKNLRPKVKCSNFAH